MSLVYISGPLNNTDDPEINFQTAATKLVEAGHQVVSPIELKKILKLRKGREPKAEELSRYCIEKLLECDSVYYIDTNNKTSQSVLERRTAITCGINEIDILYVNRA